MNVLNRFLVWLRRFPYRKGYGVHSPFAFDFITWVIYEKAAYYAYSSLDSRFYSGSFFLGEAMYRKKCSRFLFRFINFVHPDTVCLSGKWSDADVAYLKAGCQRARWIDERHLSGDAVRTLFLFSGDEGLPVENQEEKSAFFAPSSVWLVQISDCEQRKRVTELVEANPLCRVSFDLYKYIIVFMEPRFHKQHYIVNF